MKNFKLFLFLFISFIIRSQSNSEYSEAFKEPEGWTKLIQIRNGNTALVEITKRSGIFLTLYGTDRKVINSGKLPLTKVGVKLGGPSSVPAIYDINGDVTLFVLFWADSDQGLVPTLFRVIVDGKSGKLKDESQIIQMGVLTQALNLQLANGEIAWPNAWVEKDPDGDSYAIISHNTLAVGGKSIKVAHFGPEHNSLGFYDVTIPAGFNQSGYLGAYVKDNYVIVGTTVRNYIKGGNGPAKFMLTKFSSGNPEGINKELAYNEYNQKGGFPNCRFVYNKVKNNILMILVNYKELVGDKEYYDIIYQPINPSTMDLAQYQKADLGKINDYYKNKLGSNSDFNGIVQATAVRKDGNLVLLFQSNWIWTSPGNTNNNYGGSFNLDKNYWGDIGIAVVSPEGKTLDGWAAYCYTQSWGSIANSFNYDIAKNGRKRPFGFEDPSAGRSWYFNMDMVATDNANYLFLNTSPENYEKPATEKAGILKTIVKSNAVQYTFSTGGASKKYMFGEPSGRKDGKFCNFTASDYNAATKTYCTIMNDAGEKKSFVVWFKLD